MKKLKVLLMVFFIVSGCATVPSRPPMTFHQLGCDYYGKEEYDAAISHFKSYIALHPDSHDSYSWIGRSYAGKRQYKDAASYYQKAIAMGTTNPWAFANLANCYNNLNQYNDAIKPGIRAIELDFSNDSAHFQLAWAFFKTKQYKNAVKAYKKAIELKPEESYYYYRWGCLLKGRGDYADAAEQYKKAASLQPTNWTYLSKLADAYYKQGRCDDAIEAANKAIGLNAIGLGPYIFIEDNYPIVKAPTTLTPTLRAGLESAKRAGIETGDRIIKINGQLTEGWSIEKAIKSVISSKYVNITIQRKGLDMPIEKVIKKESIISQEASNPLALRSLALIEKGKHEEAYKDAEHAYSLNSSDGWAQLALGASNLDQGRYDEAIKLLSQVKGSNTARILEATAYARKGDFKRAVDIYSAIPEEKLSPENVPLWSDRTALLDTLKPFITSKMESADRLKARGRYKEALKELGEAMKIADNKTSKKICGSIYRIISMDPRLSELPEEARKYALRGDVMTEEGKFEDAVKEYRQAVQSAPYIAKLYFNTAMIYGELKRHPQAIRYMKTYLQLAPEAPNVRAAKDQIYKWEFAMEKKK